MKLALRAHVLVSVLVAAVPRLARADGADDFLKSGRELVEQGKIDQGCALIFQAESMQPTINSIGLVAACHEKQGKLAKAYREYLTTAERAAKANDERQKFARDQAAGLEKRIGRVTVKLAPGEAPKITVGGEAYVTPHPVDPGAVTIVATDPGGKTWKRDLSVAAGEAPTVEVPPVSTWAGAPGATSVSPQLPTDKPRYAPGPPPPAIVAGAVGIAGLGVMGGAGIAAIVLNNEAESDGTKGGLNCPKDFSPPACSGPKAAHDRAVTASTVADVGLGVGVVGVGLAAIFWGAHVGAKTVDEKHAVTPPVDFVSAPGGGALVWRGAF